MLYFVPCRVKSAGPLSMTYFHYYPQEDRKIPIPAIDGESEQETVARFCKERGLSVCDMTLSTDYYANKDGNLAGAFTRN